MKDDFPYKRSYREEKIDFEIYELWMNFVRFICKSIVLKVGLHYFHRFSLVVVVESNNNYNSLPET